MLKNATKSYTRPLANIKRNSMRYIYILIIILLLSSCKEQCEVCEVLKNGEMIEMYESCDEEGIKTAKSICKEMAELQNSECECHKRDKLETE